jgi:hypothetical protein
MSLTPGSPSADFFASQRAAPPAHLGTRYDKAGAFQPEPGNTIVCHVVDGSETQRALIDARNRYLGMPEADHLTFTPVSSLHMTLFSGVIVSRRAAGEWPPGVPLDAPIDEATKILVAKLEAMQPSPPFKVAVQHATPIGLHLDGATQADRTAMRGWRDRLADLWGLHRPDHQTYPFHMTFAYVLDWLPDEALPRYDAMLAEVADDIRRRAPVLELRPPAFCAFNDMNHFQELRVLPVL